MENVSGSRSIRRSPPLLRLRSKFIDVVDSLGVDEAVPEDILRLMGDENLTLEDVVSYLKSYRGYLRRLSKAKQQGWSFEASRIHYPKGSPHPGPFPPIIMPGDNHTVNAAATTQMR